MLIVRGVILRVLATVGLLVAAMALGVAPASASPKPIGLSSDGVTFADHLPAPLFGGAVIVPGHSTTRSFWVKNRMTSPGNLAITLRGVSASDDELAGVLTVTATVGAASSSAVPVPAAATCQPLVSAVTLTTSAIVRVDVTVGLAASVHTHATQGALGAFDVGVTLTSTDVAAPDGCAASVTPPPSDGGGGVSVPVENDTVIVGGTAAGSVPDAGVVPGDSGLPDAMGSGSGAAPASGEPYGAGFLPWIALAACLVALFAGGIFAAWRRTRNRDDYPA